MILVLLKENVEEQLSYFQVRNLSKNENENCCP